MNTASSANIGRAAIALAVLLQATGEEMFGTWLAASPYRAVGGSAVLQSGKLGYGETLCRTSPVDLAPCAGGWRQRAVTDPPLSPRVTTEMTLLW